LPVGFQDLNMVGYLEEHEGHEAENIHFLIVLRVLRVLRGKKYPFNGFINFDIQHFQFGKSKLFVNYLGSPFDNQLPNPQGGIP
jgi:hypothetical protein